MGGKILSCADCGVVNCKDRSREFPRFCLTAGLGEERIAQVTERYQSNETDLKIAQTAAVIESEFYGRTTRVEETLLFIKRMGYKKVGVAACVGLLRECSTFAKIARAKGIEVYAAACKIGGVDKTEIGIPEVKKLKPGGYEAMCNPILQAEALNEAGTDFNVVIGLCVGHDTLFLKYSKAPVTYLIVKDRVLCHNPAGALYMTGSYYARLLGPDLPEPRGEQGRDNG